MGWGGGQERDDRRAQLGTACSGSSHRQPLFQSSCLSHHPSPRLVPSCPVPSNPVPPCRVPCGSEEKKTRNRAPAVLDRSLEMGGVGGRLYPSLFYSEDVVLPCPPIALRGPSLNPSLPWGWLGELFLFLNSLLLPMPATSASHLLGWNAGQIAPEGGRTGGFRDFPLLLTPGGISFYRDLHHRASAGTIEAQTAA